MVHHNNMIPNGHFQKKWQPRIKTWFNQPMKKVMRKIHRTKKLTKVAPKPVELLRPTVHCPSVRYNTKLRPGRGFTLQELKQAGLNKKFVRTIGIAVDYRRKNRCCQSLMRNAQRLKEFQGRLILFPKNFKQVIKTDNGEDLNKVKLTPNKMKVRKVTEDEKQFQAYVTLRRARSDAKHAGVRIKTKLGKSGGVEGKIAN